jgi:hypothetical protein
MKQPSETNFFPLKTVIFMAVILFEWIKKGGYAPGQ